MSSNSREAASRVAGVLRAAGHAAFFVGGCVRDALAGQPVKDFDLATDARPERVLDLFDGARSVGAHFGVVLVPTGGEESVEVATFRSDHAYRDGRRPEEVTFETDPRQDVLRRDFTINGLLEDPFSGEVIDYVGGLNDLRARQIRAIGAPARRFEEDRLRMLRAVRFAARLDFTIEPATFAAVQAGAPHITAISAERVRDEISRILLDGGARRGFELLDSSGLLAVLLPEVAAMKGVAQPPEFHPEGDVWIHTLGLLGNLGRPSLTLALAALLHDVGKPPTFRLAERIRFDGHVEAGLEIAVRILERLKFSRAVVDQTLALIRNHMRWMNIEQMKESTLKRFFRLPGFDEHLELHRLDCLASHGGLEHYEFARARRAAMKAEQISPPPLLSGDDLIASGYPPGPAFKAILRAVEDAQLDGALGTRAEALEFVRERFPPA